MKKNKQYKLIPYIIFNKDNLAVIQNERATCVLKDENLIDFFKDYDSKYDLSFTFEYLQKKYKGKADFCLEFLLKNSLAVEVIKNKTKINKIHFFTNSKELIGSLNFNFKGFDKTFDTHFLNFNDLNLSVFDNVLKDDIVYIILTSFNFRTYTEVANKLRGKDVMHKFVFYYNYSFYFTNYFKTEWHNPCPLCFFCHLEGSLRAESKLTQKISFQTLMDLIYTKTSYFNTEIILNNYKILKLVSEISKDVQGINDYNIKMVKKINACTFDTDYDIATHWEPCICNE